MPCEPDSGLLKSDSLPFRPLQVLNSGCCFIRDAGMNQPMWPVTPFGPPNTTVFCLLMYCLYWSTCCQSSSTASVFPFASAWYTGISAICVMLTLQPRYFSSAALATYVLAVEPAHACSFSVTVPQLAFVLAPAVPTTSTAIAAVT